MKIFLKYLPVVLAFSHTFLTCLLHAQTKYEDSLSALDVEFVLPPDSVFIIDNILVLGNEKTKAYVLLREMTLTPGDYITAEAVEYDKKRIYNLGLFTRVEIGYSPTVLPKATLVIVVSERWFIYPFPLVGIKDRDWKKFYFGGGVTHQNFRGRNEKLYVAGTIGYDPTLIFFYRNPLIDADHNFFLNTSLAWRVVRNRSLTEIVDGKNFDERHLSISMDFGKRFGLAHTGWVSGGYRIVYVTEYRQGRTISPDGRDAFPEVTAGYTYDTRDLEEYAMTGSFIRATVVKYGVPGGTVDFTRTAFDVRRFIPLVRGVTLAGRVYTDLASGGQIPTYSRVFLGYSERVRGHFSRVLEGEQQLGTSWELRMMVMEPRFFRIDAVPIPEFSVWKFGIAAALFADAGTVWYRGGYRVFDQLVGGYGAGVHFLLPYGFVLRTEYALDEYRRGEIIFDFSAAF